MTSRSLKVVTIYIIYRSRAPNCRSKLKAALGLRDAHANSSLFSKTFLEKVRKVVKIRGSKRHGYDN